jgi:hypothetical protein
VAAVFADDSLVSDQLVDEGVDCLAGEVHTGSEFSHTDLADSGGQIGARLQQKPDEPGTE